MNHFAVKIKTREDTSLTDDQIVHECMAPLMEKHPGIKDYTFIRDDLDGWIHILIYGDFVVV